MTDSALPWPLCVPVLSDGIVTLRAHTRRDIPAMLEMMQDPAMLRWTSVPYSASIDDAAHFVFDVVPHGWRDGSNRVWAIETTETTGGTKTTEITKASRGCYCGNVDLRGSGSAEIGFALQASARGRGLASRAVRLAAQWGFSQGRISEIRWKSDAGNLASHRVAQACGFTFTSDTTAVLYPEDLVTFGS